MKNGFITLPLTGYIALGSLAVITLVSGYAYIQTKRLEACKAEHKAFVSEVERLGNEAKVKADLTNKQNLKLKEQADEDLRKLRIDNAEFKRLRDSNPPSRRLPGPEADSKRPDLSCFDRPELERAYGELVKELRGIADEGTEATIGLNTAKRWATPP